MAKKNQHWEVEFRMLTEDEWTWKNLPFTLKFEDKESAEKKYKEIVDDIVENGHGSWPGLSDSWSNKIIEEKEYDKGDSFCRWVTPIASERILPCSAPTKGNTVDCMKR